MNSVDSIAERMERIIEIGQKSPELRLPPVPEDWRINIVIDERVTLTVRLEDDSFVLQTGSINERKRSAVRIQLEIATLNAILANKLTPTKALARGTLITQGLELGHFTDPSIAILFQLLRCGIGRRLPSRKAQQNLEEREL